MTQPRTAFEWPIYANATFAGLSILIPILGVDWLFEEFFRRRIPTAVAKHRGHTLAPFAVRAINKGDPLTGESCLRTCLTLPVILVYGLLKRLSRKLLYFLTIKEATDKISYYWHQAFLVDYMLLVGHLENEESALIARQAMDQVLQTTVTSPLHQLARQVATGTRHILKTLRRAKQGTEDEMVAQKKSLMIEHWGDFETYFKLVAANYEQLYHTIKNREEDTAGA